MIEWAIIGIVVVWAVAVAVYLAFITADAWGPVNVE